MSVGSEIPSSSPLANVLPSLIIVSIREGHWLEGERSSEPTLIQCMWAHQTQGQERGGKRGEGRGGGEGGGSKKTGRGEHRYM